MVKRCEWGLNYQISIDYHDKEWGVPVHDDKVLFEFLVLEGAQARIKLDNYSEEKRELSESI